MPEQTKQTDTFDQMVRTGWADELHPQWCAATDAVGCGTHHSEFVYTPATGDGPVSADDDGIRYPAAITSTRMDRDGTVGIHIELTRRAVVFTVSEARQYAMRILAAAELAEKPTTVSTRKSLLEST